MKFAAKLAAAVSVALALTTASVAMADSRHDRDDRRPQLAGRDDRGNDRREDRREDRRDDRRDDRADDRRDHWDDRRDDRRFDRRYDRRDHDRWDDRGRHHGWYGNRWHHDRGYRHPGPYYRPYGYVSRHWRRGDRLPPAYCDSRYVVHDHYAYRLREPPRGYRWVRVDGDVILAAIATGIVLEVLDGYFG